MNDPRLPARAMEGAHFSTVDVDGSVREWVRFRGAWVPLLVDERSYTDRHADLRASRSRMPLRDCSNAACPARVQMGIPHCCQPCRDADPTGAIAHSAKCVQRQIERGVTL
jgi:hypothetical protein